MQDLSHLYSYLYNHSVKITCKSQVSNSSDANKYSEYPVAKPNDIDILGKFTLEKNSFGPVMSRFLV